MQTPSYSISSYPVPKLLVQTSINGEYDIEKYKMGDMNVYEDRETIMPTHVTLQDFHTEEESKHYLFHEKSNEYTMNEGTNNNLFSSNFLDDMQLTNFQETEGEQQILTLQAQQSQ